MQKVLYILGRLSDDDIDWLGRAGTVRHVPPGAVLIREGQPIDTVYVVLDGAVDVHSGDAGAIARLGAGEMVGEMSMVDDAPPSATVAAGAEGTVVLELPRPLLEERIAEDDGFAARFYRAVAVFLSSRLRRSVRQFGYVAKGAGAAGTAAMDFEEETLDDAMLDSISHAGERFRRILDRLGGQA